MKILYSYRTEEEKNEMAQKLSGHEVVFHQGSLQEGEWSGEVVECLCVFVTSNVGKTEIEKCPNLKLIATRSTGFDHIDTAHAKSKGIVTSNVPAYGSRTVAEFTFALLLDLSRKISLSNKLMKEKKDCDISSLRGFDLNGKTIGVVGTGKIGKNVVKKHWPY